MLFNLIIANVDVYNNKNRECKLKNIIFNEKHSINLQVVEVIIFKIFIENCKIAFSFTFNINENIFIIY